jgi:2-hydroxychromene-2-carboxylate isomerase
VANPVKVEFQFDFGSPNAYLAEIIIPAIEKRIGVKFDYVPVLLGGVYKATNNMSPFESLRGIRNKPEYQALETQRFIRRHHITTFKSNPFFPVNTLMLMRGAVAAQFENVFDLYFRAAYHHMWEDPKKMDDLEIFRRAFISSGIDIDRLIARAAGRGQEEADREYQRCGFPGSVRLADVLCGQGNVFRQGSAPRCRGSDRRTDRRGGTEKALNRG